MRNFRDAYPERDERRRGTADGKTGLIPAAILHVLRKINVGPDGPPNLDLLADRRRTGCDRSWTRQVATHQLLGATDEARIIGRWPRPMSVFVALGRTHAPTSRCLGRTQPARAAIQHDLTQRQSMIGIIAAKIVAVLAVGGAIFYGVAYVGQRGESDGIRSRVESAVAPSPRRRSSSLEFLQRRVAEKDACTSGRMAADCNHLVQREAVPAASVATPGSSSQSAESRDPPHTGTLKASAKIARHQRSRKLAASSLPHPSRVAARSRAHQAYAARPGRTVRWAARPQRWPGVGERYYPRLAYSPWWVPSHPWHERSN